jgi:excisionase family DNA binding protein
MTRRAAAHPRDVERRNAAIAAQITAQIVELKRELAHVTGGDAHLLTVAEVAEWMGRSERTVWRWVRSGALESVNVRGRRYVRATALADLVIAELTA